MVIKVLAGKKINGLLITAEPSCTKKKQVLYFSILNIRVFWVCSKFITRTLLEGSQ